MPICHWSFVSAIFERLQADDIHLDFIGFSDSSKFHTPPHEHPHSGADARYASVGRRLQPSRSANLYPARFQAQAVLTVDTGVGTASITA